MSKHGPGALPLSFSPPSIAGDVMLPEGRRENDEEESLGLIDKSVRVDRTRVESSVPQASGLAKNRKRFMRMLNEIVAESKSRNRKQRERNHNAYIDRDAFLAAFGCPSYTPLDSFKSAAAIRIQLQAEFFHLHYAKEGQDFFPSKMILIYTPETASFAAATDALYLTQIATSTQDQRLQRNAARSYREALVKLRKDLSNPKACHDDHVFGTIHILSLCEAFKGLAIGDIDQDHHTKGAAMLFQARGPESLQGVYMKVQLQQHHRRVLIDALLSHKRPLIGKGPWLDIDKNCHLNLTALTTLALQVPGALEDADELLARAPQVELDEIMDALSSLKSLETRLLDWMISWYAKIQVSPYRKVPVSTLTWLPSSDAFASALHFPTPLLAKGHVLFWMPLLCLREAVKQVAELHPFPLLAANIPRQGEELHDCINECADNLCMTAMFLTNPSNGADGLMEACGPLLVASRWFQKVHEHKKLRWCYQMFQHIESRGIRAPSMQPFTRLPNARPP